MESTLIFFAEKMWVAKAALPKLLLHFYSKNINVFENTLATTVNEFVINKRVKLTMLWTAGPRLIDPFFFVIIASTYWSSSNESPQHNYAFVKKKKKNQKKKDLTNIIWTSLDGYLFVVFLCVFFLVILKNLSTQFCLFVLFGPYITFNNISVISQWCLDVAGSSMLIFRNLSHWNITPHPLDMIFHPLTVYWHWTAQFWFLALLS